MILKSKYYKYPTSEERFLTPKVELSSFDFKQQGLFKLVIEEKLSPKEIYSYKNIYHWNIVFSNSLGKLKETYTNLHVHYNRGFQEKHSQCNEVELVDKILFDYYIEVFYYFFFSANEKLAQILRHFYRLNDLFSEYNTQLSKSFIREIKDNNVSNLLIDYLDSLDKTKDYRNSFAHRFPKNEIDSRVTYENNIISGGIDYIASQKEFYDNIYFSINNMSELIKELKKYINKTTL